jgi:hypothetical protein
MSILDKIRTSSSSQNQPTNQLTTQEIEVLLSMIKRTSFLGEDIEPLYNLVIKLQDQYNEQIK